MARLQGCSSYLSLGSAVTAPLFLGTQPPYVKKNLSPLKFLICILRDHIVLLLTVSLNYLLSDFSFSNISKTIQKAFLVLTVYFLLQNKSRTKIFVFEFL